MGWTSGFHARDDLPRAYWDATEFRSTFLNTHKCSGDIINDNDTMNRHKSECIVIQSILCNNVFTTHVNTIILVAKRNLKTLWGALWHVKIISLVLSKAEHYVGSNRHITSSISWAVTPSPQTIFTFQVMTINNYFHISGKMLIFKGSYYICRNGHI